MKELIYRALLTKAEAEKSSALATLEIYMTRPAGIGEHPQIVDEAYEQLSKLSAANDNIKNLKKLMQNGPSNI